MTNKNKSEEQWKKELSEKEFEVLRKGGTEKPFSGKYVDEKSEGIYKCKACGNELFSSDTKFKSGSGWPSFYDVVDEGNVEIKKDRGKGMVREEVVCADCGSHLGHLFKDGPKPTGKRYCINSVCLDLESED